MHKNTPMHQQNVPPASGNLLTTHRQPGQLLFRQQVKVAVFHTVSNTNLMRLWPHLEYGGPYRLASLLVDAGPNVAAVPGNRQLSLSIAPEPI